MGTFFPAVMEKTIVYEKQDQIQSLKQGAGEAACYDDNMQDEFPDRRGNQNAFEYSEILHIAV